MVPTPEELQALRMAELEAAYNAKAQQRAYAIQERSLTQQAAQNEAANALTQQSITNQYNLGQQGLIAQTGLGYANIAQQKDAAAQQKQASLISAGIQAPMTAASIYGLGKQAGWWGQPATVTLPGGAAGLGPTGANYAGIGTVTSPASYTTIPTTTTIPTSGMTQGISTATVSPTTVPPLSGELASAYEGGTGALQAGETFGTVSDTATGVGALGDVTEAGSLATNTGMYSGIGEATEIGMGTASTSGTAGSLTTTGASGGLGSFAAPVAAGLLGGSLGAQGAEWVGGQLGIGGSNERSIAGGVMGGAAAGAAVGSVFPIVGTAVGGIIGGIVGGIQEVVSDGTVICTELHRQGLLDDETYAIERRFGQTLTPEIMDGYHTWAKPVVRAMKRSRTVTRIVQGLTHHTIKEMAHRVNPERRGSAIGAAVLRVGIPLCRMIGRIRFTMEVVNA